MIVTVPACSSITGGDVCLNGPAKERVDDFHCRTLAQASADADECAPGPHVAGTDLRLARECVRAAVELSDHRIDVPEAVAEHDFVVRPAEARDVSLGIAEQACGPEEATSRLALLLFGELAPF